MKIFVKNLNQPLIIESPFLWLRGKLNYRKTMGFAHDKEGKRYEIKVAGCGTPNCYCAALAIYHK